VEKIVFPENKGNGPGIKTLQHIDINERYEAGTGVHKGRRSESEGTNATRRGGNTESEELPTRSNLPRGCTMGWLEHQPVLM